MLDGALPQLSSLLLIFFNGSFGDPTTVVDQVASSGRLARIFVSDDDNVDEPFPCHFGFDLVVVFMTSAFW